jgi:hypothetical protein
VRQRITKTAHLLKHASNIDVHLGTHDRGLAYAYMYKALAGLGDSQATGVTDYGCLDRPELRPSHGRTVSLAQTTPVVLLDIESKIAWLVPQISVIFDLVQYLSRPFRIPRARVKADGAASVVRILEDDNIANFKLSPAADGPDPYLIKDLVLEIWATLAKIKQASVDYLYAPRRPPRMRKGWFPVPRGDPVKIRAASIWVSDLFGMLPHANRKEYRLEIENAPSWLPLSCCINGQLPTVSPVTTVSDISKRKEHSIRSKQQNVQREGFLRSHLP